MGVIILGLGVGAVAYLLGATIAQSIALALIVAAIVVITIVVIGAVFVNEVNKRL